MICQRHCESLWTIVNSKWKTQSIRGHSEDYHQCSHQKDQWQVVLRKTAQSVPLTAPIGSMHQNATEPDKHMKVCEDDSKMMMHKQQLKKDTPYTRF